MKSYFIGILIIAVSIVLGLAFLVSTNQLSNRSVEIPSSKQEVISGPQPTEPVDQFKVRITKKPFAIYITPATSPVQPERFTGFHTGVDVEYEDVKEDVAVKAIQKGEVVLAQFVSGYGGTLVIRHEIEGKNILALYAHLNPNSLPKVGVKVSKAQNIGVLGKGESQETDGERKHLHFGILKKDKIDLRGYVPTQDDLAGWQNPLELF